MTYYVEMKDGKVIGIPKLLSTNDSDSPNDNWGAEQMKLNGYLFAEVNYDDTTQIPDYANPIISDSKVSYNNLALPKDESSKLTNEKILALRAQVYPSNDEKLSALWESWVNSNSKPIAELTKRIQDVDAKYPLV